MVVGEMDPKEPQVQVPWIPTTPVKVVLPKPVPICTPLEGNHMGHHANGAVACFEFSSGSEKNNSPYDGSVAAATVTDIAGDNGKTCEQTASDNVCGWGNLSFSEIMFPAEAASANSYATQPDNNNGLKNPFIPSIIHDNSQDPQETTDNACCTKRTSQDTPVTEDNAIKAENRQLASMQINMEEKDPGPVGEEKNVPAKMSDNNETSSTKDLCDPVVEFAAVSSPFKNNHIPYKGSSHDTDLNKTPQQKPRRRKHRPKVIKEGKPKRTQKPVTPKPVQPKENPTGKRKYVRRKGLNKTSTPPTEVMGELTKEMPESVNMSCRRSLNFDIGAMEESSTGRENATALLGKENGVVVQETNIVLANDLNTSIKQASDSYMSLPEYAQAPNTSTSRKTRPRAKLKEYPTGKRKYERRKGSNKTSAPPTEETGELTTEMMPEFAKMPFKRSINVDKGAREESSEVKENATVQVGIVMQEMNANLAYDVNTSMKQESNGYVSLTEDMQVANTSSRGNSTAEKPKKNPTAKRKYVRKSGSNKSLTPTEVTGELTKEMMPKSAKTSCRRSLNFDKGGRDESSADKKNAAVHLGEEIGVVMQEIHVSLAYDLNTSTKQASNNYMSLPDEQAPNTPSSRSNPPGAKPRENPTGKRKYVRRKGLNKSLNPPTDMAGELTEVITPQSLNFHIGTRDASSAYLVDVHVGEQKDGVVEQTPVGLTCNPDTWMKQTLNNCMPLPEDTQAPGTSSKSNPPGGKPEENPTGKRKRVRRKVLNKTSTLTEMTAEMTCRENLTRDQNTLVYMSLPENAQSPSTSLSKSNNPGATLKVNSKENKNKRKGLAISQDGDISNSQLSTIRLQTVGSNEKHSGTIKCADNSSMNLIGAHYNGLPSYQTKYWVQFPNIQKKRRTEKGKTSNIHISSVTTEKEVQLTCPLEYAPAHPFASNSSCWFYGPVYNAAIVPAISEPTENVIDKTHEFDEFILSLRRLNERSQSPTQTCNCGSLTRIRNCVIEPSYAAKQLSISDRQTFWDAERPQTSIDALVAETHVSLPKKKRNRKRNAHPSSAYSHTNEMQQHNNFALGSHYLPLGKSLDIAPEVTWMHNVKTLTEQFRQLNINTEAIDLHLHAQNALVPFRGFDPIKKQHPRPKVDLDEETDKVWKLLMLDINSHGIDGTDEDKAKWWEEERNVFRGRADSFIARMHLVQGDRRFSRWKGSVVDSVVGVFLTQNVSDHLSSSAFMSLAARFPPKSSSMCKTSHDEGTSLVVNEPQVHIEEPEENTEWDLKLLNQSVYDRSSMTMDIVELSGEKEAVNSNDSCRVSSGVISSTDESNCRLSESSQRNIKEHHCPMRSRVIGTIIEEGEEKSHYGGGKELNDVVSSQCSVVSSQISGDFSNDQNPEKIGSCSDSNSEVEDLSSTAKDNIFNRTSFSKLLEMVSTTKFHEVNSQRSKSTKNLRDAYGQSIGMNRPSFQTVEFPCPVAITHSQSTASQVHPPEQSNHTPQSFFNISGQTQDLMQKERGLDLSDHKDAVTSETNEISSAPIKLKSRGQGKEKRDNFNWDNLRIEAQAMAGKREKTENTMDSLDWDAVRCADVSEIANTIKERGMNNRLAERIKDFLDRLVEKHGGIDLEWLRDVPPDQAKEYLLSIRGLGLKSVECVRLLTLHHLAFPVDTNVGRIAVRLGWVPLQPLPESLQLHLLELYPVLESIQKYLWPRLCKLDQRTLYELHYQMITFGKVFCTKSKPNCNACPMRGECRHFASAFASARLALPGPEQKSIVSTAGNSVNDQNPSVIVTQLHLPLPENTNQAEEIQQTEVSRQLESKSEINICQPIIEEPTTPEPECSQVLQNDMEDAFYEDSCEIPTIQLNIEEFTLNLQNYMQENMALREGEMSKALVALNPEAASIPMPKLKNVSRLRTEHCVYELPDTHPLLKGWDTREPDDPGKYLLAIWTPGETANSIQPPETKCSSQEECGQLCNEKECFSCNSFREANSQIVRGTLLIPCRTAMRGSFPLNGTYFQVNEVFADHDSSLNPISVPRSWIWNLNRRTVYFGTSVPTIFKGLSTQEIQQCFWRGYVCVRGFDRKTRAPRPLMARLHFPASKMTKTKEKIRKGSSSENSKGLKPNPEQPELISNSNNPQDKGTTA